MEEPVENNFGDHTEFMIQALQLPYSEQMGVSERLRMRKREKKGWARDRLNSHATMMGRAFTKAVIHPTLAEGYKGQSVGGGL